MKEELSIVRERGKSKGERKDYKKLDRGISQKIDDNIRKVEFEKLNTTSTLLLKKSTIDRL